MMDPMEAPDDCGRAPKTNLASRVWVVDVSMSLRDDVDDAREDDDLFDWEAFRADLRVFLGGSGISTDSGTCESVFLGSLSLDL